MAPSSGANYKNYFNDSTFSDLAIRLSDHTVYVHRIALCSCSTYFRSLNFGGYKENGCQEIELHGDDPDAMMELFRCMYDLPRGELFQPDDYSITLKSLAELCVVAEKYQIEGVQAQVAEQMEKTLWEKTEDDIDMNYYGGRAVQDFLAAIEIVFNGTMKQDNPCREALANFCVLLILDSRSCPGFRNC